MKQKLTSLSLSLLLLFSITACGQAPSAADDASLTIAATTYPVYLFTTAITDGVAGVSTELVIQQQTSCLHDYTLTVNNMKTIEKADIIVKSGAGLEDFMSDALASAEGTVIDASEGVTLLPALGHEGHDHETEYDPHIWMDPGIARSMLETIAAKLAELDPSHAGNYETNALFAQETLSAKADIWAEQLSGLTNRQLITFHDGFQYFANAFDLTILKSIEEEEGSEASARDIREIIALIGQNQLPAIFTEVNGSDSTAQAIARETGVTVSTLTMIMSGSESGLQPYLDGIQQNIDAIVSALGGT